jgi:hypothetical protein
VIGFDEGPLQDAAAAPGIEDDACVKGLAVGGDDDAVVLAERGAAGGSEMQVERAWMQGMQRGEERLTPLMAEALLAEAGVHEEVVDPWKVSGLPFAVELSGTIDGGGGERMGFFG